MKLLLDEHYANEIASQLRAAGHDAVTLSDLGVNGMDDEPLLALGASEHRTLLTNNARDCLPIAARWATSGEQHHGLLLTSDDSMPRSKNGIGQFLSVLRALMDPNPGTRVLVNQMRWLP